MTIPDIGGIIWAFEVVANIIITISWVFAVIKTTIRNQNSGILRIVFLTLVGAIIVGISIKYPIINHWYIWIFMTSLYLILSLTLRFFAYVL